MPILYKVGDLLASGEKIIGHGVNDAGKMGAGIALAIRKKWPTVYSDYLTSFEIGGLKLGTATLCAVEDPSTKAVLNIVTQKLSASALPDGEIPVSYDAVSAAFRSIRKRFKPTVTIAIPKIGAGLGGGSWDAIHHIIEDAIKDSPITVIVYVLDKAEIPPYGRRWYKSSGKYGVSINGRKFFCDTKAEINETLGEAPFGALTEVWTIEGECDLGDDYVAF